MSVTTPRRTTFQEPGETCQSCEPFWRSQHLAPRKMVRISKHTDNKAIEIVVCPHCDGDMILRLNQ